LGRRKGAFRDEFQIHSTLALLYSYGMAQRHSFVDEELAWAEDEAAYAEYELSGEAIPIAAVEQWVRSWGTENELPPPTPSKSSFTPSSTE
jgi:predicted transcriptional regulator